MAAEGDVESGGGETERPPTMLWNLQPRWSFICKVYSIITVQLLLPIAVASMAVFVRLVALFFVSSIQRLVLYIVLIFVPFITLCPLKYYHQKYPLNYFVLFTFTVTLAFTNWLVCAFESRNVILEAVVLITAVVSSLTLQTFWATRRGHDFNFLCPFLSEALENKLAPIMVLVSFYCGRCFHNKRIAGKAYLEKSYLEPALKALKDRLMTKNVAGEIAEKLCESVAASLEGKKLGSFTRISSTVHAAMEEALVRILTPRHSIDILRDVHAAKEQKKPYV